MSHSTLANSTLENSSSVKWKFPGSTDDNILESTRINIQEFYSEPDSEEHIDWTARTSTRPNPKPRFRKIFEESLSSGSFDSIDFGRINTRFNGRATERSVHITAREEARRCVERNMNEPVLERSQHFNHSFQRTSPKSKQAQTATDDSPDITDAETSDEALSTSIDELPPLHIISSEHMARCHHCLYNCYYCSGVTKRSKILDEHF